MNSNMDNCVRTAPCAADMDQRRLMRTIEELAQYNDTPELGITRFSYTPVDRRARDYLFSMFEALGLAVKTDATGNVRARYEGSQPELAPVLVGSHIDSVRHGGRYDGVAGVACAIEVVRALKQGGVVPRRAIEVIIFAEEEGSNFGTTMVGSKAMVGKLDIEGLQRLRDDEGATAFDRIRAFNLEPEKLVESRLKPGDIHAMVELHIEQGEVLCCEGLKIGVVEAIAGMVTLSVTIAGSSNHAGATPMHMRQDAMVAAAYLIQKMPQLAADTNSPATVATVGSFYCEPNMPNVIPKEVRFTVDIRDIIDEGIDSVISKIYEELEIIGEKGGLDVECEVIGRSECIRLSEDVVDLIEEEAQKAQVPYKRMSSGAVHDTAQLSCITDAGMIFVPSREGKSHCPEEFTEAKDLLTGCGLLLRVIQRLAGE